MDKLNKLILPASILIGSIVLGGFLYASETNKQNSIERQQAIKLEEDARVESARAAQAEREFIAKRKTDCLDIYKTEGSKWNNVRGWRYSEDDDQCFITYKESTPKSAAECDKLYAIDPSLTDSSLRMYFVRSNLLCKDGEFENSF